MPATASATLLAALKLLRILYLDCQYLKPAYFPVAKYNTIDIVFIFII